MKTFLLWLCGRAELPAALALIACLWLIEAFLRLRDRVTCRHDEEEQ